MTMTRLERYFAEYAAYHSDRRNEVTHMVGIPMIVLAVTMWASRIVVIQTADIRVNLASLLLVALAAFYISLSLPLGVAMSAVLALLYAVGVFVLRLNAW